MELDPAQLRFHAQGYDYDYGARGYRLLGDDDPRFPRAGDEIRARGYTQRQELYEIARWKSPRRANLVNENPDRVVHEVTEVAITLMACAPDYTVNLLAVLKGIGIPTASAVLAVVDPKNFGIIDIRAWRTLSQWRPDRFPWKDSSSFLAKDYLCYLKAIQELAEASELSCREVDMALWHIGAGYE
jgi:thermostable 8-oxoguanine DNA glycosylase